MKAPTIITSMARALGIVSSVEEVAIVPLEQWLRVFERLRAADARVVGDGRRGTAGVGAGPLPRGARGGGAGPRGGCA